MDKSLEQAIRDRAKGLCEYCRFPEEQSELRHVIDHVIAKQHRGETIFENLALACGRCNRSKGPNIAGLDPDTAKLTRLFNPRTDQWNEHFDLQSATLIGLTDVGRVTVEVLAMNHPYRIAARQVLLENKML